jgi:hypothetical protein
MTLAEAHLFFGVCLLGFLRFSSTSWLWCDCRSTN